MAAERLQKIIAAAGIAARRKAEELITSGQVSVNGQIVTELGTKADPEHDHIKVNGKLLSAPERHVYLLLHKPKGYVTTVSDPEGRPTVMDLVRAIPTRVYPVGRLDYLSEGLLLLTNDGELAQKLTHASSHVPKTYLVKVSGNPSEADVDKLRGGIKLPAERSPLKAEEGTPEWRRRSTAIHTAPARIELLRDAANPWYEVTLVEGRNRQIRRMFEEIGHHVEKIRRVKYGPLELNVEPGQFRHLTSREVALLRTPSRMEPLQPFKEKQIPVRHPTAESVRPVPRRDDKFKGERRAVSGSRPNRPQPRREGGFRDERRGSEGSRTGRSYARPAGKEAGSSTRARAFGRSDKRSRPGSFGHDDKKVRPGSLGRDNKRPRTESFGRNDKRSRPGSFGRDDKKVRPGSFSPDDQKIQPGSFSPDDQKIQPGSFGRTGERNRAQSLARRDKNVRPGNFERGGQRSGPGSFARSDKGDRPDSFRRGDASGRPARLGRSNERSRPESRGRDDKRARTGSFFRDDRPRNPKFAGPRRPPARNTGSSKGPGRPVVSRPQRNRTAPQDARKITGRRRDLPETE